MYISKYDTRANKLTQEFVNSIRLDKLESLTSFVSDICVRKTEDKNMIGVRNILTELEVFIKRVQNG